MNVVCIDNEGSRSLTLGKEYKVLRAANGKLTICNDRGSRMAYFGSRFKPVGRSPEVPEVAASWDEASRGPQMASPTGRTIFKYAVPTLEQFHLSLPRDAQIIRIAHIDGFTWLWAVVDLRKPCSRRLFRAFKTGATIPDTFDTSAYIGFYPINVQMELGLYVFEEIA
ncbi:hypothetical protein HFN51_04210 [Rhizobium leguminosarum]|nr:hypothetical protein [Rhizobium leguminosarum]